LAVKVEQLLDRLTAQATTTPDPTPPPKKVTFTQSAVTETTSRGPTRDSFSSPASRPQSPDDGRRSEYDNRQTSSRSAAWLSNTARQPSQGPINGGRFVCREVDTRRFTTPTPRQSTSGRPPARMKQNDAPTATQNFGPRYGTITQHILIQLISVCMVTVIFVVTHTHQAVNFVRPLIFNGFSVQNWAIWPKCVVVDQQLQAINRTVHTRDSHPDALRVRVI
jgi:hypothetical protein